MVVLNSYGNSDNIWIVIPDILSILFYIFIFAMKEDHHVHPVDFPRSILTMSDF